MVPMIGILLGATINNEALPINTWAALTVILMAVAFNQIFEGRTKKTKEKLKPVPA